jgi:flagellar protein FliO/FliZ
LAFVLLASVSLVFAANAPSEASTFGTFFQVVAALAVVVAAIAGAAWLMRRALPLASAGGHVRVVGGTMVGPRERVVVVEVGDTWIVLGVTATQVNALHTLARPPVTATADSSVGFPSLLARLRKPSP